MLDLVEACKLGHFPSISTMSKFGLLGYNNTNPIEIFEKYKNLINQGVTEKQIIDAEKNKKLCELLNIHISPVPL
jgi:hypothetical protein